MLPTTIEAIKAILRSDPTIAPDCRTLIITSIRNYGSNAGTKSLQPEKRLIRPTEVARRLSVSTRTVHILATQGILHKKIFPGRKRSCGFLSEEVDRLISDTDTGIV